MAYYFKCEKKYNRDKGKKLVDFSIHCKTQKVLDEMNSHDDNNDKWVGGEDLPFF